jgi:NAD(P)H-dependent FMN reductase
MKLIVFGASNSKKSKNRRFANWAASQTGLDYELLDLNDYEMPVFSVDKETASGIPQLAHDFKNKLKSADGIIISLAEYNKSYTSAFKNIFDWFSRIETPIWPGTPMLLLSTSPGKRGADMVLDLAVKSFPWQGGNVADSFSLPSFNENFDDDLGIVNKELLSEFKPKLEKFAELVKSKSIT